MVVQEIRGFGGRDAARPAAVSQQEYMSLHDIWSFLRRHFLILVSMSALGALLGGLYVAKTEPTYTAIARIVIDHDQARVATQDASTGTIIIEAAEIASEVEIVKSEAIARAVINQLDLTQDPEILSSSSWRSKVRSALAGLMSLVAGNTGGEPDAEPALDDEDLMRRTMAAFLGRLSVRRVGQSYVLEIGYTSTDPQKAALAANAVANTYMRSTLDAKSEIVNQGATWIQDRLLEVGRQAHEAALAVEQFRNDNGIAQVGNATALDQQQLAETNSELLKAQADTASAVARLETIDRLLAGELADGYVGDAFTNPEITRLRGELGAARTRLETLRARYGPQGGPVAAGEIEIARLEGQIRAELSRIQGVYRADLETARARETLLETKLDATRGRVATNNLARAELAELESRATTYRRMYESVLQQLITTLQKRSFPIGDARMVTAATPPLNKIWPKTTLILPLGLLLGLVGGLGIAVVGEVLDRRISSGERLGRELGLPTLGYLPFTRFQRGPGPRRPLEPSAGLRHVLDSPYSGFSEALRGVKNAIDATFPASGAVVVGVTSLGGNEGKSTVAANLAQLYSNEEVAVVLVDASFTCPAISRLAKDRGADFGLSLYMPETRGSRSGDGYAGSEGEEDGEIVVQQRGATLTDADPLPADGAVVPVLTADQIKQQAHPGRRYGHLPALKQLLDRLRGQYKIIIVDLSTFPSSADTRVISTYLDGILLVLGNRHRMTVEWLAGALATFGKARVGILGVVFNRTLGSRRWLRAGFGRSRHA